ncbi:histone H1/H5 family protein, partial [Salmonella sp. s51228]|uniref:histone H1/H5 family protein n=1 Tax=Salmonella sp. s51228 TaxID=3159652 RepID=UPI0039800F22
LPIKTAKTQPTKTHPPYQEMIRAAFIGTKSVKGLSKVIIDRYIKGNYSVNDDSHNRSLKMALKKMLDKQALLKQKGIGLTGSFKLNKSLMVAEMKKVKQVMKPPVLKKSPVLKKPPVPKKPATKRA